MRLDRYLRKEIHTVAGYLATIDATAISELGRFQSANGVKGDLCEIGVHHGRLFFILALLRQVGEKALPVDLFLDNSGNDNEVHRGRDKAFFNNSKRLNIEPDDVLIGNTLELKLGDFEQRIGKARIISVDAGHLYQEVANDLELAAGIVSDDGVIIADDYFNILWPDVTTATNDFLKNRPEFVPFLITPGKFYICKRDKLDLYKAFAERLRTVQDVVSRSVEFNRMPLVAIRFGRRGEVRRKIRRWL